MKNATDAFIQGAANLILLYPDPDPALARVRGHLTDQEVDKEAEDLCGLAKDEQLLKKGSEFIQEALIRPQLGWTLGPAACHDWKNAFWRLVEDHAAAWDLHEFWVSVRRSAQSMLPALVYSQRKRCLTMPVSYAVASGSRTIQEAGVIAAAVWIAKENDLPSIARADREGAEKLLQDFRNAWNDRTAGRTRYLGARSAANVQACEDAGLGNVCRTRQMDHADPRNLVTSEMAQRWKGQADTINKMLDAAGGSSAGYEALKSIGQIVQAFGEDDAWHVVNAIQCGLMATDELALVFADDPEPMGTIEKAALVTDKRWPVDIIDWDAAFGGLAEIDIAA